VTPLYVYASIVLAALSVPLLVGVLTLLCGSFAKAMRKLRGLYALFVLVIVLGLLGVGGVLICYGLSGPDQTQLYLGIGALVAAAGLFDLGTRHLKTWEGLLGAPDSFKRWCRLMGEIRLLWDEEPQTDRKTSYAAGPSEPPAPADVAGKGRTFSFSFGLGGRPSRAPFVDALTPFAATLSTDAVSVFPSAITLQLERTGAHTFRQQLVVIRRDARPLRLSTACDLPFLTLSLPREADAGRYVIDVGIATAALTAGSFDGTIAITTDETSCRTLLVSVSAQIE